MWHVLILEQVISWLNLNQKEPTHMQRNDNSVHIHRYIFKKYKKKKCIWIEAREKAKFSFLQDKKILFKILFARKGNICRKSAKIYSFLS